jgi:hypothetical protein
MIGDQDPGQRLATPNPDGSYSYSAVPGATVAKNLTKQYYDRIPPERIYPSAAPASTLGAFGVDTGLARVKAEAEKDLAAARRGMPSAEAPFQRGKGSPKAPSSGSLVGLGLSDQPARGPQPDIGDLVAGVKPSRPRATAVESTGQYYGSLPSAHKVAGLRQPNYVAAYVGNNALPMGPRRQAGESAATPKDNTGPSFERYGRGAGAFAETKPESTASPSPGSPSGATGGTGTNFSAGPVPGGGGRGNDDRPRKPRKKPKPSEDGGKRYSKGGSVRGDGMSRVSTKGKVC